MANQNQDNHKPEKTKEETKEKIFSLIEDIDFCMLVTHKDSTEMMQSRPMSITKAERSTNTLWFFTSEDTRKASDIEADQQVNVSFLDKSKNSYVSVSGTAKINKDKNLMAALWQPSHKIWFPDGLETPGICLLQVSMVEATYWDATSSSIIMAFQAAKALITGTEYSGGETGNTTF